MTREILRPDYDRSLLSLAASFQRYFGLETENKTLESADRLLYDMKPRRVLLVILDGMGTDILCRHLPADSFLRRNFIETYSSTFPPTTVAATTTIDSGLEPCAHGWLGWTSWNPFLKKNVETFSNTDDDGNVLPLSDAIWNYLPYKSICERIREKGMQAHTVSSFGEVPAHGISEVCAEVKKLMTGKQRRYIYSYSEEPDHTMHRKGIGGPEVGKLVWEANERLAKLCSQLHETAVFITADHGHIDCAGKDINDYPAVLSHLSSAPGLEPRAVNLFVKAGEEAAFESDFKAAFGDSFLLMTRGEVIESRLFGRAEPNLHFAEMIGDYMAIAVADDAIFGSKSDVARTLGIHAGLTKEEMEIPLIAVRCD
ncbi:MAG: alkaline phosphatase family protein [Eubacteriales bacterium]|nr:alkaline phosphatase family protein [Eubacteriales bacterium]MDD3882815.1 alkaline phosphatase family protein [Eubacteriales bacterium]MDD4513287.1 alkaline phosphatase family protein [Eubacteriales bacterium]